MKSFSAISLLLAAAYASPVDFTFSDVAPPLVKRDVEQILLANCETLAPLVGNSIYSMVLVRYIHSFNSFKTCRQSVYKLIFIVVSTIHPAPPRILASRQPKMTSVFRTPRTIAYGRIIL
jgi:hypothetical protein